MCCSVLCCFEVLGFWGFLLLWLFVCLLGFFSEGIRQTVLTPLIQGGDTQTHHSQWRGCEIQREFIQVCTTQQFVQCSVPGYPNHAKKENAFLGCPKRRWVSGTTSRPSCSGSLEATLEKKPLRILFSNTGSSGLGASLRERDFMAQKKSNNQCIYQSSATGNQCLIGDVIILQNAHSSALISVQTSHWHVLAAVEVGKVSPRSCGWATPCCRLLHSSSGHPPGHRHLQLGFTAHPLT